MIMKPDGSAYIVPASVYDEQPIPVPEGKNIW